MVKSSKKLISKMAIFAMCISFVPTDMAFAKGVNARAINVPKIEGSAISYNKQNTQRKAVVVTNESDFKFSNGTIYGYTGSDSTVVIPNTIGGVEVRSIGKDAFTSCKSLSSITIPKSVESIEDFAFYNCTNLSKVIISNSVKQINVGAFHGCTNLNDITVDPSNSNFTSVDGVLFNKQKTKILKYPAAKESESYTIPDGITSINEGVFVSCTSLKSVVIPNNITSIGFAAFEGCSGLSNVTIPKSVTSIDMLAFNNCDSTKFYVDNVIVRQTLINNGVDENRIIYKLNPQKSEPLGDVNDDGKINIIDVFRLKKLIQQ